MQEQHTFGFGGYPGCESRAFCCKYRGICRIPVHENLPGSVFLGFDWAMDWGVYPLAFDDDGNISDVILPDVFRDGKIVYTRLERHKVVGQDVEITQRAFKSMAEDALGTEISLSEVERWSSLQEKATVKKTDGPLFGWYKVASANTIDVSSPIGASVFAKAVDVIRKAGAR